MQFVTREFDIDIKNVYDYDEYLLSFLKTKYENKCFNKEIILKIKKILTRSDFIISREDFQLTKIYVDICFEAECSKLKPKTLAVFTVKSVDKQTICCEVPITANCKITKTFNPSEKDVFIAFIRDIDYKKAEIPTASIEPFRFKNPVCFRCVDIPGLYIPPKEFKKHKNFETIREKYEHKFKIFPKKPSLYNKIDHLLIESKPSKTRAESTESTKFLYIIMQDLSVSGGYFDISEKETLPNTRNKDNSVWETLTEFAAFVENFNDCLNEMAEIFETKPLKENNQIWNFIMEK